MINTVIFSFHYNDKEKKRLYELHIFNEILTLKRPCVIYLRMLKLLCVNLKLDHERKLLLSFVADCGSKFEHFPST